MFDQIENKLVRNCNKTVHWVVKDFLLVISVENWSQLNIFRVNNLSKLKNYKQCKRKFFGQTTKLIY